MILTPTRELSMQIEEQAQQIVQGEKNIIEFQFHFHSVVAIFNNDRSASHENWSSGGRFASFKPDLPSPIWSTGVYIHGWVVP